jgi:hypothetical protein
MRSQRFTGIGCLLLGAGIALNAILGPLVLGVMKLRFIDSFVDQFIGGEIVSLFVVAPLALAAGVLWLRGHRLAPVLAFAPAIYTLYLMATLVFGADYAHLPGNQEQFFPLHWLLLLLSWAIVAGAWSAIRPSELILPSDRLRRATVGVLLLVGLIFALLWGRQVAAVIAGEPVAGYPEAATLFWMIRVFDLALFVPLAFYTATQLLRRRPGALKLAYALTGFFTCEIGAVAGMTAVMLSQGDPTVSGPVLAVLLALTAGSGALAIALYRAFVQVGHRWELTRASQSPVRSTS